MFYVGQKVVCVDDRFPAKALPTTIRPIAGNIYTVTRGNFMDRVAWRECIEIAEARNTRPKAGHTGFLAARFRPVTDISDLQSIVAEVKRGNPRKIASDQFDRERAPQARDVAPDHRPAAASLPAAPVSPSPAVEPPASFLDTARKAIEGGQ